jgi:glutamine synthetase
MNTTPLKNLLELTYDELEDINLKARSIKDPVKAEATHVKYLTAEKRIKAVTVCFSDIEGRLHMLDYNKQFFLDSLSNLTFDGSSIRGFSALSESDLRLVIDWLSLTFLPSDIFGPGKVLVFANICGQDLTPYESDFRGRLKAYTDEIKKKKGLEAFMAPEIEGFLMAGIDAEQTFDKKVGFALVSTGGYYHSLPLDELRMFIDRTAEAIKAMGFKNEKDHAEVAPSQFEINFSYTDVVRACDQILIYKLVCRQVAEQMGMTATFLPKPTQNINGCGMHTNVSLSKAGKNIFYDKSGNSGLSKTGWEFLTKILNRAPELCLTFNSSVNAYRRLDPNFEAPNQIKVSASDRGSMIRIPLANEKTARIEIRSVAPDSNPYLALYALLKTGIDDSAPKDDKVDKRPRVRFLPGTIGDAIRLYKASDYVTDLLGENAKAKYVDWKVEVAHRNPRELGTTVKDAEVLYHHEVTNQYLWNQF